MITAIIKINGKHVSKNFKNLYNGKLVFGDIDIIDLIFNIKTYEGNRDTNLDIFVARFDDDNPRRSGREIREPERLTYLQTEREIEQAHCLTTTHDDVNKLEYSPDTVVVISFMMAQINAKTETQGNEFYQQYILQKGLKIFRERGIEATKKEIGQLYKYTCFTLINVSKMTPSEKQKAVEALLFLFEKGGTIKGRMVCNGKPTRKWLSRDEMASPTVAL